MQLVAPTLENVPAGHGDGGKSRAEHSLPAGQREQLAALPTAMRPGIQSSQNCCPPGEKRPGGQGTGRPSGSQECPAGQRVQLLRDALAQCSPGAAAA